jgi:hypothetical protein
LPPVTIATLFSLGALWGQLFLLLNSCRIARHTRCAGTRPTQYRQAAPIWGSVMPFRVQVGPPQISIHQDQTVLISEESEKGLYFFDTCVISSWTIYANDKPLGVAERGRHKLLRIPHLPHQSFFAHEDGNNLYVDPLLPTWLPDLTMHNPRWGSTKLTFAFGARASRRSSRQLRVTPSR